MSPIKLLKKKYALPVLLLIVAISAVFILSQMDVLLTGPFEKTYTLEDPTLFFKNGDKTSYVINAGGKNIVAVNSNNEYLYHIKGGKRNSDFYYASEIAVGDDGSLYVLDTLKDENGKDISAERIVKYNSEGKFLEYIFEKVYEENQTSIGSIYSLNYYDGKLYFVLMENDSFSLASLDTNSESVEIEAEYIFDNAKGAISDFALSPRLEICFSTRKGEIFTANSADDFTLIYNGAENIVSGFPSCPYDIEYGKKGNIFFNDIGHRVVYRLDMTTFETSVIIDAGEPFENKAEGFNTQPIYSGMSVDADNAVSVTYCENHYIEYADGSGEEVYYYRVYTKSSEGEVLLNSGILNKNTKVLAIGYISSAIFLIGSVALLILLTKLFRLAYNATISTTTKLHLSVITTSLVVTAIVSAIIINQVNVRYYDEVMNKMCNFTLMIGRSLNTEDIEEINSPADFMNESYQSISDSVGSVINSSFNADTGVYCILYKVVDDVVVGFYSDDGGYGSFYPMPGAFDGSAEQYIFDTGETLTSFSHNSAEGEYMLALGPVTNSEGEVIALIEVGTDLYSFNESVRKLMFNIILYVTMIILVAVLIFTEIVTISSTLKKRKACKLEKKRLDSSLIRPIIFLMFFAGNISTAFLPLYGRSLWNESFKIPVEIAAALPISAELCFAALTALLAGFAVEKAGTKLLCVVGAMFYTVGNLVCGFAPSLFVLIAGSALCGIGGGLIALSVNAYIAGYKEIENRKRGFSHYNAAFLSGMNCGTVIGSIIAERFGYKIALITAAAVALVSVTFVFFCMDNFKSSREERKTKSEKPRLSTPKFLFNPKVIRYFLLILVPYLICTAFLSYFFPVFGEENSLTATQISMAFLLSGVISIYIGPSLTSYVCEKLGTAKSMIVASLLYAGALGIFVLSPSIVTCFVIVAVIAVADSFGLTSQSVYYTDLDATKKFGEGRAMGINSVYENLAQTAGPLIFGASLLLGYKKGIMLIAVVFTGLLLLFCMGLISGKKSVSSQQESKAEERV